ncbi:MAG: hypothetical protein IJX14_01040, partial [Clostridia bacterium]|nr:hypothetical protein [Clostridia bacterium]
MAGRRIGYTLALAGCLVFYIAYQMWFSWILLLTMLLLPWFSLLLSIRAMLGVKMKLNAPERIRHGAKADVRLEVHSPGVRPPLRGRIRVTRPNTGESWVLRSGDSLPTAHCGGLAIRTERAKI